jgi:hypothetical protein
MGEDGSYGGSPCVDIHMNDVNIDLAGLTILQDANITLVRCSHLLYRMDKEERTNSH